MKIGTDGELPAPERDLGSDPAVSDPAVSGPAAPDPAASDPAAPDPAPDVIVRRATAADADALVRLRAVMLDAMGTRVGGDDAPWRARARTWFTERLAATGEFAAFVVDDPELGVVSNAVGACDRHAPGPTNLSGLHGHISNVCTDPRRLRRGYARACMEAVLDWFADETQARVINLNATADGAGLYTGLGFATPPHPALQVRLDGTIAPVPVIRQERTGPGVS
ncbi:GNAT family N-acetyltransferase [Streptomyces sp. NPDC003300]|uniref:GNAT family N-acetyltransferase n=1 Tax=unclassified Streptomyces TaxID=2593676 RepID=UPI0033AF03BF